MDRRLLSVCLVVGGGCWTEEPLLHDAFTEAQWAKLQQDFAPPLPPDPCDEGALPPPAQGRPYDCNGAAKLGQQLFFEPRLSGPRVTPDPMKPDEWYPAAKTSCSTCHASAYPTQDPAYYVDIRPSNAVSVGAASPTPHNTMSLVNVDVPLALTADGAPLYRQHYGWTGQAKLESGKIAECNTPNDVVDKIALPKAMRSEPEIVALAILNTPEYLAAYLLAFGMNAPTDNASIQQNVELALGAYMRRLVSLDAPFDAFIRGDTDAIDDSAKRGFALFVGKAMCAECHRGGMFTDDTFHVTGVDDAGLDAGRSGTGQFYTPTLRNIAKTAPYMHKGTQATLGDVIDFYSRGGGTWGGYVGHLDPLMHPFELTSEEALDLQAFLVALTAAPVAEELRRDTHVVTPP